MIPDVLYMTVPFLLLLGLYVSCWLRIMRLERRSRLLEGAMRTMWKVYLDEHPDGDELP